jgi:Flp pilus assembly pilin Flp
MKQPKKTASLSLEYAILIAVVVAALVGMSAYVKRTISGKWREAADTFGFGRQYDAYGTVVR